MIERRFTKGAQVRAGKSTEKPGIEGYGAVFNEEYVLYEDTGWRLVETIKPGACCCHSRCWRSLRSMKSASKRGKVREARECAIVLPESDTFSTSGVRV